MASASSFPLWFIDGEMDLAGRKQVTQVPGANAEVGWVNPRRWVSSVLYLHTYRSPAPEGKSLEVDKQRERERGTIWTLMPLNALARSKCFIEILK